MSKLYPKLQTGGLVPDKSQKTKLTQGQQLAYEKWKSDNKYNESDDYDLAGYWKEEGMKGLSFPNLSPIEKIKEVESSKYPTLDAFYKKYPHVAGMNHSPGEVSRNPYSKLPIKNLNHVIELEKSRDIISNDKYSPQPKFKITKEQTQFFKDIQDNSDETVEYYNSPKKIQRQTLASRELVENPKYYTKEQHEFGDKLRSYMYTKPNHLPDKFKRLAPFSNGDGYMLLSEESKYSTNPSYNLSDKNGNPLNTSFDKRGQGFWQGNQFIGYQQGGTLSQLGYKRHSPYNKASSLLIDTPTGSITMKEVDHPILGISKGEIKFMLPNKEYQFKSNKVLEIPMKSMYPKGQKGMVLPKPTSQDSLALYNNTKQLLNYYNTKNYTSITPALLEDSVDPEYNNRKIRSSVEKAIADKSFPNTNRESGSRGWFNGNSTGDSQFKMSDFYEKKSEYQYTQREDKYHILDLRAPTPLYDTRIKPSLFYSFKNKNKDDIMNGNMVTFYGYDLEKIKPKFGIVESPKKISSSIHIVKKPVQKAMMRQVQPVAVQSLPQTKMSEMTPVQTIQPQDTLVQRSLTMKTIQPQVQDTLVQRPITMKTIYPSKPHVWNTSVPKRHSVERAPGLKGYNRIYQQGGQAPEMSPEQQQEIVRRVRNLRKKLPKMGVAYDPISFRHAMYVNKKAFDQQDQELLSAFDEEMMVKLMNEVPDDDQPTYKKGGSIKGKSKMYPKCKCGCGGVSVGKNKMFQSGGTMDVLDSDGNSQMTIIGGERIFSRIATKKMLQLNEEGNYKELGKFICDELYSQDKREPQYVKE